MPTLKNSEPSTTRPVAFKCPSNTDTIIAAPCPVTSCPFHASRLSSLFDVKVISACGLHEQELRNTPSLAQLQKSSIKTVSATTMRTIFNQAMEIIKSKIKLINDVPPDNACNCGNNSGKPHDCSDNKSWANEMLDYYGMRPNAFRRALVNKLVGENSIFVPKKLQERK